MATITPPEHISPLQGDRFSVRAEHGFRWQQLVCVEQIGDQSEYCSSERLAASSKGIVRLT